MRAAVPTDGGHARLRPAGLGALSPPYGKFYFVPTASRSSSGSQDHRGEGESPVADLATRRDLAVDFAGGRSNGVRLRQLVEKQIKGGDAAVPGDDEIGPGVSRRLARAA